MRTQPAMILVAISMLALGACATSEEWATWKGHPTHFASGQHMSFSLRNREGRAMKVARADITQAGSEGWWGKPVTVGQEQIIER